MRRIVLLAVLLCVSCGIAGEVTAGPTVATAGYGYLPFGPKQIPYTEYGKAPFTGGYTNSSTLATLTQRVEAARAAHFPLILKLAPAHASMLNPSTGCFDINLWKQSVSQLFAFDLTPYVADGTVAGAELVNEPHATDWCTNQPRQITKAELEEMGRYVKVQWPTLPIGGGRSDYMALYAPWTYIDFGHSQYHMRKGDVTAWVNQTVAESQAAGVALLISLDYLAGEVGDTPMTADELLTNGIALATSTYSCLMTGYLWDTTYNAQPGIMDAFAAIAAVANSHPAPPCFVGDSVKPPPTTTTTTTSAPTTTSSTTTTTLPPTTTSTSTTTSTTSTSTTTSTTVAGDTTPPSAPPSCKGVVKPSRDVVLSWTAATDNVGVARYRLSRIGRLWYTTALTSTDKKPGIGLITYEIVALDAAGNIGAGCYVTVNVA